MRGLFREELAVEIVSIREFTGSIKNSRHVLREYFFRQLFSEYLEKPVLTHKHFYKMAYINLNFRDNKYRKSTVHYI